MSLSHYMYDLGSENGVFEMLLTSPLRNWPSLGVEFWKPRTTWPL